MPREAPGNTVESRGPWWARSRWVRALAALTRLPTRARRSSAPPRTCWHFVCEVDRLAPGDSLTFLSPGGAAVTLARQGAAPAAESFLALPSTCPHVGSPVSWDGQAVQFTCACPAVLAEDGARNSTQLCRTAIRYAVRVENQRVYLAVPDVDGG